MTPAKRERKRCSKLLVIHDVFGLQLKLDELEDNDEYLDRVSDSQFQMLFKMIKDLERQLKKVRDYQVLPKQRRWK